MHYTLIDTDLGGFGLAWTAEGVARVTLPGPDRHRIAAWAAPYDGTPGHPEGDLAALPQMIRRYATGDRVDFTSVPLDLDGVAEFNRLAYAELRQVGYGETTTYGAIARRLGDLALSRAVGQAMGANPIPLIVPCHRVLAADGRTGGFSSPGGVSAKMRMLALERAAAPDGQFAFGF